MGRSWAAQKASWMLMKGISSLLKNWKCLSDMSVRFSDASGGHMRPPSDLEGLPDASERHFQFAEAVSPSPPPISLSAELFIRKSPGMDPSWMLRAHYRIKTLFVNTPKIKHTN